MKIRPGSPHWKICELLSNGANIPHGMRRAWARVPLISLAPHWDMYCPCTTNSTKEEGMLEGKRLTLSKVEVVLICEKHGQEGPEYFWVGFCDRCFVVYWALGE